MNLELMFKLFNVAAYVCSVALNIYLYFSAKSDRRFAEYDESLSEYDLTLRTEIAERKAHGHDLDKRLVALETELESLPRHEDLERIQNALAELGADVSTVKERSMNSLQSLRRIETHLLERSR